MSLKLNQKAPDFTLPSTSGTDFSLGETMAGKPCIIYFYPKDFTRGCTAEACEFRDNFDFFKELDIDILGISRDSIKTHLKFQKQHNLPYHLLSDSDGSVSKLYDALIPIIGMNKRITYLLDENHSIVAIYDSFFNAKIHISGMIAELKKQK